VLAIRNFPDVAEDAPAVDTKRDTRADRRQRTGSPIPGRPPPNRRSFSAVFR